MAPALLLDAGTLAPKDYQARLSELQLETESLEAQLAAELPQLRSLQPPAFDDIVAAMAKRLPAQGVLVEVVWSCRWWAQRPGRQRWDEPHFIALLRTALGKAFMVCATLF